MLYYTFDASGTALNDFYWQFVGGGVGPGNIELKSANGVTGIDAALPAAPELFKILKQFAPGIYIAGDIYQSATLQMINGVSIQPGATVAGLRGNNITTGEQCNAFSINGIDYVVEYRKNNGDKLITTTNNLKRSAVLDLAGVRVLREVLDVNGYGIRNSADVLTFMVEPNGVLRTDAESPQSGNDNLPYLYWKVNDNTGVLMGYLPILRNPGDAHYNTPGITTGGGAGVGATCTISGNDYKGIIEVTTAGVPNALDIVLQIDFVSPFVLPAVCLISPANNLTAALTGTQTPYVFNPMAAGQDYFRILSNNVALPAGQTFSWYYHVME